MTDIEIDDEAPDTDSADILEYESELYAGAALYYGTYDDDFIPQDATPPF